MTTLTLLVAACTAHTESQTDAGAVAATAVAATASAPPAVHIAALLIDPVAVPDSQGEWIQLQNSGAAADLSGWRLESGNDPGFVFPRGTRIPAGARLDLGRSDDPTMTGGVKVDVVYTGITLANRSDWLALRDASGHTVDSVAWSSSRPGVVMEALDARRSATAPRGTASSSEPSHDNAAPPNAPAESRGPRAESGARSALIVRLLDVGQGDAILIQNGGSNVLIDGGPDPAVLGRQLDAYGIGHGDTIAAVVLTHGHADHYLGLQELFASRRALTVRYFWENQDPSPNRTLARLRDSIGARVRRGSLVYRDTDDPCATGLALCTVTLRGGAKLHILRPDPDGQGANNRSAVVKLIGPDSASFTMWLAGDAEREEIAWFERAGYDRNPGMRVDVLKADHHGSCNGVDARYLQLTHPKWAVVSLGALNDYGHMHEQAKAIYRAAGVPWYRTDQNGTITITTPGTKGGGYSVTVERGTTDMNGPSDRQARSCGR